MYKSTLGKPNILAGVFISNTKLKSIIELYSYEQFKVTTGEVERSLELYQETN